MLTSPGLHLTASSPSPHGPSAPRADPVPPLLPIFPWLPSTLSTESQLTSLVFKTLCDLVPADIYTSLIPYPFLLCMSHCRHSEHEHLWDLTNMAGPCHFHSLCDLNWVLYSPSYRGYFHSEQFSQIVQLLEYHRLPLGVKTSTESQLPTALPAPGTGSDTQQGPDK